MQRYRLLHICWSEDDESELEPFADGDWVRYEDAAKLEAEISMRAAAWKSLADEHHELQAENARLRELVEAAYREGWEQGMDYGMDAATYGSPGVVCGRPANDDDGWEQSESRAALTESPEGATDD